MLTSRSMLNALCEGLGLEGYRLLTGDPSGDIGSSISPWGLWLLFSLILHEFRQRWVAEIFVNRLGGDVVAISGAGALAHPDIEPSGLVPGLSEWEYLIHGRGCCLTSRLTGESIDVDFYDGSSEWFDDYFVISYLKSLKRPAFVERRAIALHPTLETILLSIDELLDLGLLHRRSGSKAVRLAPECRTWANYIERIQNLNPNPLQCIRLGKALDDWQLVKESGGDPNDFGRPLEMCFERRRQRLASLFKSPTTRRLALSALVDLGGNEGRAAIESVLQDAPNGGTSAALRIIHSRSDEDWTRQVLSLLRRINPNGDIPEPYIWLSGAEYILRRDRNNGEVKKRLGCMERRELGDAAILSLEFAPEYCIGLFRRALRSSVPNDRTVAAAALSILDQPWCHAELIRVLDESDDQIATAECRAALCALPHPKLHSFVEEWERRNPHQPEVGAFISMSEMALRTRHDWLSHEMYKLNDRVLPLRNTLPPVSKESWWPH